MAFSKVKLIFGGNRGIWLIIVALFMFSVLSVYSASVQLPGTNTTGHLFKHVFGLLVGAVCIYMIHKIPSKYFRKVSFLLYWASVILLIVTWLWAPEVNGIDEFDSIGERRNYAGTGIDKENNRLITTMLNEMDGFVPYSGMLVIAATNSYASLDPALIRPGRFDLKYTIGNPDSATRAELVQMYTKGKSLSDELSRDILVAAFDGQSCAAIEAVLNEAQAICQMTGEQIINTEILLDAARKAGVKLNIKNRK